MEGKRKQYQKACPILDASMIRTQPIQTGAGAERKSFSNRSSMKSHFKKTLAESVAIGALKTEVPLQILQWKPRASTRDYVLLSRMPLRRGEN